MNKADVTDIVFSISEYSAIILEKIKHVIK